MQTLFPMVADAGRARFPRPDAVFHSMGCTECLPEPLRIAALRRAVLFMPVARAVSSRPVYRPPT